MISEVTSEERPASRQPIKAELWQWVTLLEVVCRLTLTYLIRDPEDAQKKRYRDQGVEYHLQQWHRTGELAKRLIGRYVAYYLPRSGQPGFRGNLEHDCLAGLVAARLYCDLKQRVMVQLSRQKLEKLEPDWILEAQIGEAYRYYIEFHTRNNPRRNLIEKLERYHYAGLEETECVLIVCQRPTSVVLPSDHFNLASLEDVLAAGNACLEPIWYWGGQRGRHSLSRTDSSG